MSISGPAFRHLASADRRGRAGSWPLHRVHDGAGAHGRARPRPGCHHRQRPRMQMTAIPLRAGGGHRPAPLPARALAADELGADRGRVALMVEDGVVSAPGGAENRFMPATPPCSQGQPGARLTLDEATAGQAGRTATAWWASPCRGVDIPAKATGALVPTSRTCGCPACCMAASSGRPMPGSTAGEGVGSSLDRGGRSPRSPACPGLVATWWCSAISWA